MAETAAKLDVKPMRLVVEARVREVMEGTMTGVRILADGALDELNIKIEELIAAACQRAKANGRVGLRREDF